MINLFLRSRLPLRPSEVQDTERDVVQCEQACVTNLDITVREVRRSPDLDLYIRQAFESRVGSGKIGPGSVTLLSISLPVAILGSAPLRNVRPKKIIKRF